MKKILVFVLLVLVSLSLFAGGAKEAQPARRDTVIAATSQRPVRFVAIGPDGSSASDLPILNNIYDPLIILQADGTLKPALATEWSVSSDGMVYTFKLRQNVKFHDGSPFSSEDVVATLELAASRHPGNALLINYAKSVAVDRYTVEIHLKAPFAAFLNGAAARAGLILSKAYLEKVGMEGYLRNPIGTGPYKLGAVTSETFKLEAFEDYWGGAPSIRTVDIRVMTDESTQMIALENGDIDFVLGPSIASGMRLRSVRGVVFESGDSAGRMAMLINASSGFPGEDKNFRKAVQTAINRKDIIDGTTEGLASQIDIDMTAAYSARPVGYNVVKYDINKAKEYLAASKYRGQTFELLVQAGTIADAVAQIMQAQLMEIGINATVKAVDTATHVDLWYAGTYGGMIRVTVSSLMDADGFVNNFMMGDYAPTVNNQYPRTREIYELGMKARAVPAEQRRALYLQAVNINAEEAYHIPLFAGVNTVAYRDTLQGAKVHPLNLLFFHDWSFK